MSASKCWVCGPNRACEHGQPITAGSAQVMTLPLEFKDEMVARAVVLPAMRLSPGARWYRDGTTFG
jgi:hypothetical protein